MENEDKTLNTPLFPYELLDSKKMYSQFVWEHYSFWSNCFVRWLRLNQPSQTPS